MKVGDLVKHKHYGNGRIIKICEDGGYNDCLVEFEKEHPLLDNGNCLNTKFMPIGKEHCCKYFKFDEIEIVGQYMQIKKINRNIFNGTDISIEEKMLDKLDELIEVVNDLRKRED